MCIAQKQSMKCRLDNTTDRDKRRMCCARGETIRHIIWKRHYEKLLNMEKEWGEFAKC